MEKAQKAARRSHPVPATSRALQKGEIDQSIHAELDILDTLDLDGAPPPVRLKELLLGTQANGHAHSSPRTKNDDAEDVRPLADLLRVRIDEGSGETLFDIGLEDNGESMGFSRDQLETALDRLRKAATMLNAEVRVLMTRNVGGDEDVGPSGEKDKSASGKAMIRQKPDTTQDVIETRIAVVGNGEQT